MASHEDNRSINIPAWVYRAVGFYLLLTLPWMGWVTMQLTRIDVKVEASGETAVWRMQELERRVTKLESRTP